MSALVDLTAELLKRTPLPAPEESGDKDSRGKVVVVGGCPAVPGAMLLSGMAALRGGAGKVRLAVPQSIVPSLGRRVEKDREKANRPNQRSRIRWQPDLED